MAALSCLVNAPWTLRIALICGLLWACAEPHGARTPGRKPPEPTPKAAVRHPAPVNPLDRVTCPQPTQRYEVDGWKHFAIAGDRTFYIGKAAGPIAISSDGGRTWHKHATHIPNLTSLAGQVWGFEHEVPLHSGTAHGAIYYPIRKETWKRVDVFARDGVLPTGLFECGEAV